MKIVILSTQRSGSTLVCDDFLGTNLLGKPTEHYLNIVNQEKITHDEIRDYLTQVSETPNGVQSVKIMSNQLEIIDNIYNKAGGKRFRRRFRFQKKFNYDFLFHEYKNAKFVRVYRFDKVAQAVSLIFSEKTDTYHLTKRENNLNGIFGKTTVDTSIKDTEIEYSEKEIKNRLIWIKKQEDRIDNFLSDYKINPEYIIYEDIIYQQDYIVDLAKKFRIFNAFPSPRSLIKITGKNADYWIRKYKKENMITNQEDFFWFALQYQGKIENLKFL